MRRGIGLLEVLVALAVLALGLTGMQRLIVRSVATLAADARIARAMVAAQAVLAETTAAPPEPGHLAGETADGLRFERDVRRTAHARLREVRVRVYPERGAPPCELVELIDVPPA